MLGVVVVVVDVVVHVGDDDKTVFEPTLKCSKCESDVELVDDVEKTKHFAAVSAVDAVADVEASHHRKSHQDDYNQDEIDHDDNNSLLLLLLDRVVHLHLHLHYQPQHHNVAPPLVVVLALKPRTRIVLRLKLKMALKVEVEVFWFAVAVAVVFVSAVSLLVVLVVLLVSAATPLPTTTVADHAKLSESAIETTTATTTIDVVGYQHDFAIVVKRRRPTDNQTFLLQLLQLRSVGVVEDPLEFAAVLLDRHPHPQAQ